MRDYGKVSAQFWIGQTGKALRGDPASQVLALYLMTSPHSTMTGVFHCPVLYMAHETGLGMEGASKALQSLIEAGFCEYDEASECVFVLRMAAHQIDERLKPKDLRIVGIRKEVERMPSPLKTRFLEVYGVAFMLVENDSPLEAPSKPLRSQEQEQEQEQESRARKPRGSRFDLPALPVDWEEFCRSERKDLDPAETFARFSDYWRGVPGAKGCKLDWTATWRNWVRDERPPAKRPALMAVASKFAGAV